jgi:hypothetical protein
MRNVLIQKTMLNDNGYEIVKELQSTSNQWSNNELTAIMQLLESGLDFIDIGDTSYIIAK